MTVPGVVVSTDYLGLLLERAHSRAAQQVDRWIGWRGLLGRLALLCYIPVVVIRELPLRPALTARQGVAQ